MKLGRELCFLVLTLPLGLVTGLKFPSTKLISEICGEPIGIANGSIPDIKIKALSAYDDDFTNYGAHLARLHQYPGYRADPRLTNNSWIMVDLGEKWIVTGIATQGYGDENIREWVTEYVIMASSGSDYSTLRDLNYSKKVFVGNNDSTSVKFNGFPIPVIASSVTLYPVKWHNNIALRMELYGCKPGYRIQVMVSPIGFPFMKSYLDPTSVDYISLAADIQHEVEFLSKDIPGFLSSEVLRFNPWGKPKEGFLQTEAEVEIQILPNTTAYFESKLQNKAAKEKVFLNPQHLFFHYPQDKSYQCSSPKVNINLSKNLTDVKRIYTTGNLSIQAAVRHRCKVFKKTYRRWEASAMYDNSNTFSPLFPLIHDAHGDSVTIQGHKLPASLVYVRYVAKTEKIEVSSYGFVQIERPPLVAKIVGLTKVKKGQGIIKLDASSSSDPDISLRSAAGDLIYTWFCKREDDFTYAQFSARRRHRYRFRYRYRKQFFRSIPADIRYGRPFSDDGCFGYGPGRLSSNHSVLEVDVNRMKSNYDYIFTLVVSKGSRRTKVNHRLRINPSIFFKIRCTRNCNQLHKVSQTRNLILDTKCIGKECATITRYRWKAFREQRNAVNGSWWSTVDNFNNFIEGFKSQSRLIMKNLEYFGDQRTSDQRIKIRAVIILTVKRKIIEEEAELTLILNSLPRPSATNSKGCELTPSSGTAMSTMFFVTCGKWHDEDGPPTFEFRYKRSTNIVIIGIGTSPNVSTRLPRGVQEDNDSIAVQVRIHDNTGDFVLITLKTVVRVSNYEDMTEKINNIVEDKDNELANLMKKNDTKTANEVAISLLSIIDTEGNETKDLRNRLGVTSSVATKLKNKIIDQLGNQKTDNWQKTTQVLTVVNLATGNPNEMTDNVMHKALDMLNSAKDFLLHKIRNANVLTELEVSATENFITGIGNLLQSFSKAMRYFPEMDDLKKMQMLKHKENAQRALKDLREIGDSLLTIKQMDEDPSIFSTKTLSMIVSKNSPAMLRKMSGYRIKSKAGREVQFPSLGAIFDSHNGSSLPSVQSKIIMFTDNPFTWDKTARLVNSWAIDINLYNEGNPLEIYNLNNPVGIYIPEDTSSGNIPFTPNFVKPTTNASDTSTLRYHNFDIRDSHSVVIIRIQPSNGKRLDVFVRALERPLPWEYNYTTTIPNFSSCTSSGSTYVNCSEDPYTFNVSSKLTGKVGKHYLGIRYMEPAKTNTEVLQRVRRDCGQGRRKKRSCVGVKDPPTAPAPTRFVIPEYNATTDVNYTLTISSTACLYWSEVKQKWTDYGCKPGPQTIKGSIHCLCNHLSAFGGDFFIQPNPIDFDKILLTLKNPKAEDFVVMATVIGIVLVYLVALVFARRTDKKDERKAIPNVYLSDCGDHLYEISVFTGLWRGNGTTANVGIILYGENGYTDVINLNDSTMDKRFFARGSINTFLLYLPKSLGQLYKIKIWHDNNGRSPAWFLSQVVIKEEQDETHWIFLANKWLALEKGNGEIETEVRAAEKKEIKAFTNVFHSRASHSLADSHLWASVFMRPPQSTFTRVQRLSCCLSIIFATMVTNAMFYQFGNKVHDTFQIGPLKVSWMQIKIGLQSALIAIPVNAVIVTIFRNARPKDDTSGGYQTIASTTEGQKTKNQGLRHGFVYLGWFLCIGTSIASATVIILYSLSWGGGTANEWLTSILVSFIQDIFVTQPIKVILLASLLALLLKKPPTFEKARGSPHWKNKIKVKNVTPPKGEELEKARFARKQLLKTARMIMEIVTYVLFAILLFIVCYGNRKTTRFDIKKEILHVVKSYDKVRNITGFWNWTDRSLIPGLYNTTWYNGQPFNYEEGFIRNREVYLVGMPRIRQLRIKSVECMTAESYPVLTSGISRCIPYYKSQNEHVTKYHKADWTPVPNVTLFKTSYDLRETCPRPWRYQSAEALNALPYKGTYGSYSGGGYVADLGYNNKSATKVVKSLKKNRWIDNKTSAVFIEFTVFEPATLLYGAAKILFERLPTGSLKPAIRVEPLTVYGATDPGFKGVYQTCQLLFVLIVTIMFAWEFFKVYKMGCVYFWRFWSWMDLLLIISALLAMGTLFFKEKYMSDFIKGVHENPFKSTTTDFIALWSNLEVYLLSFVIFIMTIKFLRLLRFNSHIGQLMLTLKHSTKNLQSFYVVLVIVLVAFTQVGMLLFGKNIESYSTFIGSLSVVLQKLLGTSMQHRKVQRVNQVLGSIYTFLYSITVAFLLLNVFLSILNTSYKEVRESKRKRAIGVALRDYIEEYMRELYREVMREFKNFEKRWKGEDKTKERLTNGMLDSSSIKDPPDESNQIHTYDNPYEGELCCTAEEIFESDPLFQYVEHENQDIIKLLVPLATFDNEDDILGELACLEEIKMNLRNIERDLLRATAEEYVSDDEVADVVDNKSEESFCVGSTLSVVLSLFEPEKPTEREGKDDISLYSVPYSSEEGGISDEEDENEEQDLYSAFHSRSGMTASLNSINEVCTKVEKEKSNPNLLSPHRGIDMNPNALRW